MFILNKAITEVINEILEMLTKAVLVIAGARPPRLADVARPRAVSESKME
jgi:hypothetical protein